MIHENRIENLIQEAQDMHQWMSVRFITDNPRKIADRLAYVSSYIARSGAMKTEAELLLIEQQREFAEANKGLKGELKATEFKNELAYATRRTRYLVDTLERINHDLVHIGNNLRKQFESLVHELQGLYPPNENFIK